MANVKNNASSQETQRRLLEAAGPVFAEKGFHHATIKEITKAAGASVASVNYHFHDKAELYAAVLRRIEQEKLKTLPPEDILVGTHEQQLRAFLDHFVTGILRRGQPLWERLLLAREFAEATASRESMFTNIARPVHRRLAEILAGITGRPRESREVLLAVVSIVAQCIHHLQHQTLMSECMPELSPPPKPDEIAAQIFEFSLAGLRGLADGQADD